MQDGTVVSIFVSSKACKPMQAVASVEAIPGKGLEGDRYSAQQGTFFRSKELLPDKEVTLIEQESLDALAREYDVELAPAESRRNILTTGVALNHLVGREFSVGSVRLRGIRLCEPCNHLERLTGRKLKGLTHRGGLRAQVVKTGTVKAGDPLVIHRDHQFSAEFLSYVKALGGGDCMRGDKH